MADSSTESQVVDDAPVADPAVVETAPVVAAEPTPADQPTSAFDAVVRALEKPVDKPGVEAEAPTAANRSSKDGTEPKNTPPEAVEPADISENEMKRLSAKTQERVRWLAAQKTELTGKLETASQERDTFKPRAENYDKLTGYLTRNGINSDEANNSLELTRIIKSGDYPTALKMLTPIYQEIQKRAGEVLEPDLQEDVRLGHVPHERALELQRLRATDAAARERGQRQETQNREQQAQQTNATFVQTVAKAADDWAKAKAGSDPDWDKKQSEVAEIVELDLRRNGFPKTTQEAIQRSEKALESVNARWKRLRGAQQAITATVGNGRSSARTNELPKSAMDAVNRALGE
jgi:hypothetical protein